MFPIECGWHFVYSSTQSRCSAGDVKEGVCEENNFGMLDVKYTSVDLHRTRDLFTPKYYVDF